MSVERYHRFLNETKTIVGEDHGTYYSILKNSKTSQYAWNSAPIDNNNIPRCVAAVDRHFKFPMDMNLAAAPSLNNEDQSVLYTYLRDFSIDSTFATSVLHISIKDQRTAHCTRCNIQHAAKSFQIGDIVKAHA